MSRRDFALLDYILVAKETVMIAFCHLYCHKNLMRNVLRQTGQNKQLIIGDKQENNPTHVQTICVLNSHRKQ